MFFFNDQSQINWEKQMFCYTGALYSTNGSYWTKAFAEETYLSKYEIISLLNIWAENGWINWTFNAIQSKSFFYLTEMGELRRLFLKRHLIS